MYLKRELKKTEGHTPISTFSHWIRVIQQNLLPITLMNLIHAVHYIIIVYHDDS